MPTLLAHLGLEGEADCGGVITHTLWDGPYFHPRTYSKKEVRGWGVEARGCVEEGGVKGRLAKLYRAQRSRLLKQLSGWVGLGMASCGDEQEMLQHLHYLKQSPPLPPNLCHLLQASERTLAKLRGEGCAAPETWGEAARRALAHLLQQLQAEQRRAGGIIGQGATVNSSSGRRGLEEQTVTAATGVQGGRPAMGGTAASGQEEAVRWAFRTLGKVSAALNVSLLASTCPLFARKVAGDGAAEWGRLLQPVLAQRRRV